MFKSLAQLEAYYWVARLGSFQAAADRLGLTSPSISVRIKELEQDVGTRLFTRDSRGARLTEQGHVMFDHTEHIIALLGELGTHFGATNALHGVVRIGVPDSFATCCMAPFMRLLEERHPELNVTVRVDNSRSLTQKLEDSSLDVCILAQPKTSSAYFKEFLGYQSLIWVAAPSLLPQLTDLKPDTLARQRIITNPLPSPIYTELMNWFTYHKLVPSRVSKFDHVGTIVALTVDGAGISIVPACVVTEELATGKLSLLAVKPAVPQQKIFIVYPKKTMNRGIKALVRLLYESIDGTDFLDRA